MTTFDDIRPYNDSEAAAALHKAAFNPLSLRVSKYLFPNESIFYFPHLLRNVESVSDFQENVMSKCIEAIMNKTSDGILVKGIDNIKNLNSAYVVISNHRDIVMDPAILELTLFREGLPLTELCVGSNLLSLGYVRNLMRSNRMIKVMRGMSSREIYECSQTLSSYIRHTVCETGRPVWIAQREGRAKNGLDATEQAVLKMLNMSGSGSFEDNWKSLPVIPMSISYEYESCDALRARELLISRTEKYVKKKGEDINSILTGIRQKKGHVCICFGKAITNEEIETAAANNGNERFRTLCSILDSRIVEGYHLWKTNYIAADLINSNEGDNANKKYSDKYSAEDLKSFERFTDKQLDTVDVSQESRAELREIYLRIYANPVLRLEK